MEEKKIVFKSIDEQLAEDERREAAKVDASRRSPGKAVEKAVTGTKSSNGPRKGRGKLRLKKSVRRTIGSLMLATSVVVAAVPVGGVSADSSGIYQGSKVAVTDNIELDGATGTTNKVSDDTASTTTVPTTGSNHFGGFPILREEILGGKKFYVIADDDNRNGYNSDPRPIYSLNSTKLNIEYYFEDNNGDEYAPSGGKLNLNIGYIDSKTAGEELKWTDEGKLYVSTVIKYDLYKNDIDETTPGPAYGESLYGKVIKVYEEETKYTVVFLNDDGSEFSKTTVYSGDTVAKPTLDPISPGKTFEGWNFDFNQPIYADTTINPVFDDVHSSGKRGNQEGLEDGFLDNTESGGNTNDENGSEGTKPSSDNNEINNDENIINVEQPSDSENMNPDSEDGVNTDDGSTDVIEEDHPAENANSAGLGLTGILLSQEYPAGSGVKYKDEPIRTIYVCDNRKDVTKICDNAFAGTQNVNTVEFPDNITHIGKSSFEGCTGIGSISFGPSFESLGSSAFRDCTSLKTVSYPELSNMSIIGAKAFAKSGLNTMSTGEPGVFIPKNVKTIGSAAFYGIPMSNLSFTNVVQNCNVGNCAFARCDSLTNADLSSGDSCRISNLDSVEYLFAECGILTEATIPKGFSGKLKYGTFASCEGFSTIKFLDGKGSFNDGEFDNYLITVEGPKPSAPVNYLNPTGNGSKSYISSVDPINDYIYRYFDENGYQHEIANALGYVPHTDNFFEDKSGATTKKYIFDIDQANNHRLCFSYDREPATACDLEIGNNIGQRGNSDGSVGIKVNEVGEKVFYQNKSIVFLQLDANLNHIWNSAFEESDIKRLWANVGEDRTLGTEFHNKAFYNNSVLERVTFAYGGEGNTKIDDYCFAETGLLDHVDFYDDNLDTGDEALFARCSSGSISSTAFKTNGREDRNVTFKGPMIPDYAPYQFATSADSLISNVDLHPLYYSGNPYGLTVQYVRQPAFAKTIQVDNNGKTLPGVCLLTYPNMTTKIGKEDFDDPAGRSIADYDGDASKTPMTINTIYRTHNIRIPYGVSYIDSAISTINDLAPGEIPYYRFSEDWEPKGDKTAQHHLYDDDTAGNKYYIFQYEPDLWSMEFDSSTPWEFPDKMFEGSRNLDTVTFKDDVLKLGELPFYLPDTQLEKDAIAAGKDAVWSPQNPPHTGAGTTSDGENKCHIKSVVFMGEGEDKEAASDNNVYYWADNGGVYNGIIKGYNKKDTTVCQIVPSRGDFTIAGSGNSDISEDELLDVTKFADYAARDCDEITSVSIPKNIAAISTGCFMDCDKLKTVVLPENVITLGDKSFAYINKDMDVYFNNISANFTELPFDTADSIGESTPEVNFYGDEDKDNKGNVKVYAATYDKKQHKGNIIFNAQKPPVKITLMDPDNDPYWVREKEFPNPTAADVYIQELREAGDLPSRLPEFAEPTSWSNVDGIPTARPLTESATFTAKYEASQVKIEVYDSTGRLITWLNVDKKSKYTEAMHNVLMNNVPKKNGYTAYFLGEPAVGTSIDKDYSLELYYEPDDPTPTPTVTPTPTGTPSSSSTSKGGSSSSSSSRSSSSSSSSTALPVFVNSQDAGAAAPVSAAGVNSTVYVGEGSGSGNTGSGSGNGRGSGNTTVISTAGGITDTGKISATVNGSSDNYVIKITQTQEADDAGLSALHGKYGDDISAIRYLPFDISLYDSTGTNKISPVPEGVSVSITMPIPDDLAIYGGNAKIASTAGGVLDPMTPRFTVINGVPCMTYTCTHFSPYMVWVDTANLTEAGIMDATPKTADGIHPKWFLCFGLAAIAVVMFLKKDPEEYLKKKAA